LKVGDAATVVVVVAAESLIAWVSSRVVKTGEMWGGVICIGGFCGLNGRLRSGVLGPLRFDGRAYRLQNLGRVLIDSVADETVGVRVSRDIDHFGAEPLDLLPVLGLGGVDRPDPLA
jgi:hypothetical protein